MRSLVAAIAATLAVVWGAASFVSGGTVRAESVSLTATAASDTVVFPNFSVSNATANIDDTDAGPHLAAALPKATTIGSLVPASHISQSLRVLDQSAANDAAQRGPPAG